jgi:hypothetical protein
MYGSTLAQLNDAQFHRSLLKFDEDLARDVRQKRCPDCGGALHAAPYPRKPRGAAAPLSPEYCVRLSFCCAVEGCRHRATPPSLRFLGPKVYWAAVVVLISAMRCGVTPTRMQLLKDLVGVSRQTVLRWKLWWQQVLPQSPFWRAAHGAFHSGVELCDLPQSLLEQFAGNVEERLLALLRFLAPLSGGRRSAAAM